MIWKEFGTPLLIGIIVGGALIVWTPDLSPAPVLQEGMGTPCVNACYTWMFDEPMVLRNGSGADRTFIPTVLVVRDDRAPFVEEPVCDASGCPVITWHTPYVGTSQPAVDACECPAALRSITGTDQPVDVETDIRLSFYAFNDLGELLTTNAPTSSLEAFRLYGDFTHWNTKPWYFGTGNSSAQTPEIGVEIARAALDGVPVGGIVTIHLPEHEYDWLLGPVWITARVEA